MADISRMADRRRNVMLAAATRWQRQAATRTEAAHTISAEGPGAADSAARQARFVARESLFTQAALLRKQGNLPVFLERKIGPTLDFLDSAPTEAARKAGRPVARIVTSIDPSREAQGFATGFLISPTLLMTNWHVFPDAGSATGTGANFLHDFDGQGIEIGVTFAICADTFFVADEQLDFAIVAIDPLPVAGVGAAHSGDLGLLGLSGSTSKILVGMGIDLVEYPDGGGKKFVTRNNRLVDILDDGFLHYESDTLEGSSGSPAFSEQWELVALHHAGIPEVKDGKIVAVGGGFWQDGMPDDQIHWIANEGVRISAIVASLSAMKLADVGQAAILKELLATMTDPTDEITKLISGPPAQESLLAQDGGSTSLTFGATTDMATNMTFTGPVTINVYAGTPLGAEAAARAPIAVAVEKSLRFDPDYDDREGYDPGFLGDGMAVPPPTAPERDAEMYKEDGAVVVLRYHHYSLAMNKARRLQMWSAVNVDYDPAVRSVKGRQSFGTDRWIGDPRIPAAVQIMDPDFYGPAGQIDRGHIVRREDNAWGATPEALEFANSDTFHWTNCTPQHAAFNRASPPSKQYGETKGLWGGFESYIQQQLLHGDTKACILAGPMLLEDDPKADFGSGMIQYPIVFWKVVVVAEAGTRKAYGFVLSQKDVVDKFGIEFAVGQYGRYQKTLAEIEVQAGIKFDPILHDADTMVAAPA